MKPDLLSLLNACGSDLERYVLESHRNPNLQASVEMVFNSELKAFALSDSAPRIILVADNPGERERVEGRYLVGPSGKKAKKWFQDNMNLVLHRDVLVLNKTPISTPRTHHLAELERTVVPQFQESQQKMADIAWQLTAGIPDAALWIVGLSHFGPKGIFAAFCERLRENAGQATSRIFLFPHFSFGHFRRNVPLDPCSRERFGQTTRLKYMKF